MMADERNYEAFWTETMTQLRPEVGDHTFGAWFDNLKYLQADENSVTVGVPSSFHRDQIQKNYQKSITDKLAALAGKKIDLAFEIIGGEAVKNAITAENSAGESVKSGENGDSAVESAQHKAADKPQKAKHPQLRDDYSFERYVIDKNNDFAANAALAISKNPGKAYNPFLIYGGVGLGKTHLMQAIGNRIHETLDSKVICVASEDFLNEYIQGIQENKMNAFKNKFRYVDVLLIDDIQFLAGKDGCQEELFHTFNALHHAKKQLIFTCDRPVSELKKFSERLTSRLDQGLKADLQPPRYEARCAILRSTAESQGIDLPDDVVDLISKNVSSNVRDLISALNNLIAYTNLMGKSITLEIAQKKLRDLFASPKQSNMSIENIQRVVAEHFRISPNDLKGSKRTKNIVFPRQLAMYIIREITDFSTSEIGGEFGGRDHSTVMHSIDKITNQRLTDTQLDSTIEALKREVKDYIAKN